MSIFHCPASISAACFGAPASSIAVNNMCTNGNVVVNGYCCPCATGRCIGPCVNKQCPDQYTCNIDANACCPSPTTVTSTTASTTKPPSAGMIMSIGPCKDGQCPVDYVCLSNNLCYPTIAISLSSKSSNLIATTMMTTPTTSPPFIIESTIPCQCPVSMFCDTNRFCSSATEIDGGGTRMRCQCQEGQVCGRGNMCYMITFPSRGSSNDN